MSAICQKNCIECGKCTRALILEEFDTDLITITPRSGYGIAIDIGTTTVVAALIDLSDGTAVLRHSFLNPQRAFGPDVITRIEVSMKGKLDALRECISESISAGINKLILKHGIGADQIIDISIGCNTVMTYLLLGLPCQSLGVAPFKPAYSISPSYNSRELFPACDVNCEVQIIPWFGAFIGGDVTAGLAYLLFSGKKRFMLIDLGTNGEVALYDNGKVTVTATAAGPAFEQPVLAAKESFRGASEVMSALASLVRAGEVNKRGAPKNEDIFTRQQIGDIQLAKSAIRSGIEILLEDNELKPEDLDAVYLAGGIGQAMNIDDAVDIGILPDELKMKSFPAGNSSLSGAAALLIAPEQVRDNIEASLSVVTEINLATHSKFSNYFMRFIMF